MSTPNPTISDDESKIQKEEVLELKQLLLDSRSKKVNMGRIETLLYKINLTEKRPPAGNCFLHVAVICKIPENIFRKIVDIYNERNISLNLENDDHITPLDSAFMAGYMPGIRILMIQEGIEIHRIMEGTKLTYYQYFQREFPEASKALKAYLESPAPKLSNPLLDSICAPFSWMFNKSKQAAADYQVVPQHPPIGDKLSKKPAKLKKDD